MGHPPDQIRIHVEAVGGVGGYDELRYRKQRLSVCSPNPSGLGRIMNTGDHRPSLPE